jgi:hypothetical protein
MRYSQALKLLPGWNCCLASGAASADVASLVVGGASPDPRYGAQVHRPGQAPLLHWAGLADPFCLVDLIQSGPDGADREEQVRIDVQAGGIVAPVRAFGHGVLLISALSQ